MLIGTLMLMMEKINNKEKTASNVTLAMNEKKNKKKQIPTS